MSSGIRMDGLLFYILVIILFLYNFQRKSSSHIPTYSTVPAGFYILSPGFSFSMYPRGLSATNRTGLTSGGTAVLQKLIYFLLFISDCHSPPLTWKLLAGI